MSKTLKKYKKELKSLFNNVPKEKRSVYDHICKTIDEYPNVDTMSYDDLVEQFGEPENIYYQYIDDNDLYSPVQKHKRSHKKIFYNCFGINISCICSRVHIYCIWSKKKFYK